MGTVPDQCISSASNAPAAPVEIYVLDIYKDISKVIKDMLKDTEPEDVMILATSLNQRSSAVHVVNSLVKSGYNIHVARSGALADGSCSTNSTSVTQNKIRFKTYHSSKGLESPVVFVINPNPLLTDQQKSFYVAITRACRRLIIFQDHKMVTMKELETLCERMSTPENLIVHIKRKPPTSVKLRTFGEVPKYLSVSSMFSFIDMSNIEKLIDMTSVTKLLPPIDEEATKDMSKDDNIAKESYAMTMVVKKVSSQGKILFVDVLSIVGQAIIYAAQYFICQRLPKAVTTAVMASNTTDHPQIMEILHTAINTIITPRAAGDSSITHAERRLPAFGAIATCLDSLSSFCEKITLLTSFDFMINPKVFSRFERTVESIEFVLQLHPTMTRGDLKFDMKSSSVIKYQCADGKSHSIKMFASPTITTDIFVLVLIHKPYISSEDTLYAIGCADTIGVPVCYISNIFTGELRQCELAKDKYSLFMSTALHAKLHKEKPVDTSSFISSHVLDKTTIESRDEELHKMALEDAGSEKYGDEILEPMKDETIHEQMVFCDDDGSDDNDDELQPI